jgi:hypothetical protein
MDRECSTLDSSSATRHGGAWGERRYSSYSFTTSALDGGEWSASRLAALYPRGKDSRYPLYRRLDGPRAGLNTEVRGKNPLPPPGIEPRSPGRPARSQTLYCLSLPGSLFNISVQLISVSCFI